MERLSRHVGQRISRPDAQPVSPVEEEIMRFVLAALAAATLAFSPVVAADSGPYVGAGIGYFGLDADGFDGSDTAFKLFGGYRMNQYFATELEYIDGGKPDDSGFEIDISGFNLSVLGSWPVTEQFDVFAKLGVLFWDAEARGFGDESGEDFSYGIGADFKFGDNWAIRGEYQRFEIEDTDTADLVSLGVYFRF
jgi:OOP family OmpA-OmpF porin